MLLIPYLCGKKQINPTEAALLEEREGFTVSLSGALNLSLSHALSHRKVNPLAPASPVGTSHCSLSQPISSTGDGRQKSQATASKSINRDARQCRSRIANPSIRIICRFEAQVFYSHLSEESSHKTCKAGFVMGSWAQRE